MNVKELITKLLEQDMEAEVVMTEISSSSQEINDVDTDADNNVVLVAE